MTSKHAASTADGLLTRTLLFGNPDRAAARLSPDGRHISFLAPIDGVLNVWVAPVEAPEQAKPITHDAGRGIQVYYWAHTSQHLVYQQDTGGDENWHVFLVSIDGGPARDLTPLDGIAASLELVSRRHPGAVLIGMNDREPQLHDLYSVELSTGQRTLVMQNEGFASFVADPDYRVRFAFRMLPNGGTELLERTHDGWQVFLEVPHADALTTSVLGFDEDATTLYTLDSRDRNTAALRAYDVATASWRTLAEDADADVDSVLQHPRTGKVQAASATYDRVRWHVVDVDIARDLERLAEAFAGDPQVVSRTTDDARWLVAYLVDDGPVRYVLYDRGAGTTRELFVSHEALTHAPLTRMHPLRLRARDGMTLISYLTLPGVGAEMIPPAQPLPMVLLVHGGPWARDVWGYNPLHQWLANRGYAVLSVNYRGSTGFGKAFLNAANMEWAGKMHDDLLDAVDWAIEAGYADPQRVAIMGGSYGGYATLVGLTFTPERFACGVDIVGPSNIITLLETIPPYWEPLVEIFTTRVGDHRTEEGRAFLQQRSPLARVDAIVRPLLIGQGANDPRVKQAESDQIVAAMTEKGIPVTYVLYPDEGHGFVRPPNRLSFFAITEAFLGKHLGGRVQMIGDDLERSTVQVPSGADHIPELQSALERAAQST